MENKVNKMKLVDFSFENSVHLISGFETISVRGLMLHCLKDAIKQHFLGRQ